MADLPIVVSPTREAIFAAYEADARQGFRLHLGASLIGKPCERALWYDFRWTTVAQHPGRLLRLFETGQLEEARIVRNLRRIGATVLEVDPETGRQWRVEAHGGHFGGSLDAVALNLLEAPRTWHVLEFKTHASKSFVELVAQGVRRAKPQHFAQMQIYLRLTTLTRAMYLAVNKNNDDLYVERVEIDADYADRLLAKAGRIIFAARPLDRVSEDPAWYECRMCDHAEVCRGEAAAAVNCRTCLASTPVEGGWRCERHERLLSEADQRAGCDHHLYLPDLVLGEQIDAGTDWVSYQLPGGGVWCDRGRHKFQECSA
jgi:hypothetical protein